MFELIGRICGVLIVLTNIITLCMMVKTKKSGVLFALTSVFLYVMGTVFCVIYAITGAV